MVNEVHKNTLKNKNELGEVLRLLLIGFNKHKVREKLNISKSNLSNYLTKLERLGNIQRIGKYEIKVLSSSLNHINVTQSLSKLNKRGHAHNFTVIFPKETDLRKKPTILNDIALNKIIPLKMGNLALDYKKYRIWINKSTLTIYSSNSYFSDDALRSKFLALSDLDNFIKYFKAKYNISGIYGIEIFREHYGLVFNKFAQWILSKGVKMEVKYKGNNSILWVDDSKDDDIGLKEFEGISPLDVNNADNFFESCEKTSWKVTPEFILTTMNGIQQNQLIFAENMKSHIDAIQRLGKEVKGLSKAIRSIKKENNKLKLGNQRSLFDY